MKAKTLSFGLVATPAWAEVCDKTRPSWSPLDGAVSALGEVGYFAVSPIGIALAVLFALHLWFSNRLTLYLTLVTTGFAALAETEVLWAPNHFLAASYSEGCRGLPWITLPIILLIACISLLWYRLRHDRIEPT